MTPVTRHSTPCMFTLHPAPHTLYPGPYTLHPTPYPLHPTPYILHPAPDPPPRGSRHSRNYERISQNIKKVNFCTKSSTYCLMLLIEVLSGRFCGRIDFLKLIVSGKDGGCMPSAALLDHTPYIGTSFVRNHPPPSFIRSRPPPKDYHRALGIPLL